MTFWQETLFPLLKELNLSLGSTASVRSLVEVLESADANFPSIAKVDINLQASATCAFDDPLLEAHVRSSTINEFKIRFLDPSASLKLGKDPGIRNTSIKNIFGYVFRGHENERGAEAAFCAVLWHAGSWNWLQDTGGHCVTGYFCVRLGGNVVSEIVALPPARSTSCGAHSISLLPYLASDLRCFSETAKSGIGYTPDQFLSVRVEYQRQ
jgi:hypothetical protein